MEIWVNKDVENQTKSGLGDQDKPKTTKVSAR